MALKILLACSLVATASSSALSSHEERHRPLLRDHKVTWPVWYRDRLLHARHDRSETTTITTTTAATTAAAGAVAAAATATTTVRNPWTSWSQISATRSSNSRRHAAQQKQEHNLSGATAIGGAKYDGTRAIAYARYHGNHRGQSREAIAQSYQLIPNAGTTYTRHRPGLIYTELTSGFSCCSGWSQFMHLNFGCNKPKCSASCLNGGTCVSSGKCVCPKGYTGNQCQTDIDECVTEKPCDQLCTNLLGSYRCHCRIGFQLQQDGQSCRRNDTDDNAFEAHDLESDFHDIFPIKDTIASHNTENEVDKDDQDAIILRRLIKLEKQIASNRKRDTNVPEMNTKVTLAINNVNEMRKTFENMQLMQQEIKNKINQHEAEMRKIQHQINRVVELENHLRLRYRSTIPINNDRSLSF